MKEPIQGLWVGADFWYYESRFCLIEINGKTRECLAVKISWDEPHVTANTILNFKYDELVKYCTRGSLNLKSKEASP